MNKTKHNHACHCGTATHSPHETGENGCKRFITGNPTKAHDDPDLGEMWYADGNLITGYTLRFQRGYFQHPCDCWSRWEGSVNSLPDET